MEVIVNVAQEADAGEGIGLINLVADLGEVGAAFHQLGGGVIGRGAGAGVLEGAGVGRDRGKEAVGDRRRDGPAGGLGELEDEFAAGGFTGKSSCNRRSGCCWRDDRC